MDTEAQQEAKKILADFMSLNSSSSGLDVSFNDREQLAELHKQIEMKKAYRDDMRRLNFGLYTLKRGMTCVGNEASEEKLANDNHNTIEQVVEKNWQVMYGLKNISSERTPLSDCHQALLDQGKLAKLQSALRLQEQLRAKLASTRIVKQWDREKSTLAMEQKELSKLEQVDSEITHKRKQMLDRKYSELANVLIRIGETVERAEELRMKLMELTKHQRNDLHDDQNSETDLRSDEAKRDVGSCGMELAKGASSSAPMFEPIDWNLGSTSVDLRFDLSFKNPNDYPDILAHLCSIDSKKMELMPRSKSVILKQGTEKPIRKKEPEQKSNVKKDAKMVGSSPSSVELITKGASPAKIPKMVEKVTQPRGNDGENVKPNENRKTHDISIPTAPPVKKTGGVNPTKAPNARPLRKTTTPATPRKIKPNEHKRMGELNRTQTTTPHSGSSDKSVGNKATPSNQNQETARQQPSTPRGKQEKKQQPLQQQQQQTTGSNHTSPRKAKRVEKIKQAEPDTEPMELDSEEEMIGPSSSNNSLDFGMQSSSCEFDLGLDAGGSCVGEDDDLDFLCESPGRVTRSKAQKRKTPGDAESGGNDHADTFDFGFDGSNSSECLDGGMDDLF